MKVNNQPLRMLRHFFKPKPKAAPTPTKTKEIPLEKKFAQKCFSQHGEDRLLRSIFLKKKEGFYVDVGAHHPFRFSNTALFYQRGWRGLNIDATPGSMTLFKEYRARDINLEVAVSDQARVLTYHLFNEPALNTFDSDYASQLQKLPASPYTLQSTIELKTQTLAELLDQHLPPAQQIDFLSVDVEHHDLEVLRSNNWEKYRPAVVVCEVQDSKADALSEFIESLHYKLVAKTLLTGIYLDQTSSDPDL